MRKSRNKREVPKRPEYDRLIFDILHDLAGVPSRELADRSWLSQSTIDKIRRGPKHGGTRYPRGTTTQELARLAGGEIRYQARVNEPHSESFTEQKLIPFVPRKRRA